MSNGIPPNKLESAFFQRDATNSYYEQINISGSDLIIYHSSSGEITADRISVWAAKYGIGGGGTASLSSSYAYTASNVPFNGSRSITRNDSQWVGINVGGTNVVEFLNNFFFPFVTASVQITTPSTTTYYETGSTQNRSIVSIITPNNETIFGTGSVRRDGLVWNTIATIPPYTASFTDTGITSSHTYQTFIQADNNGSPGIASSAIRTVSFIYPYLWGLSSTPNLTGSALYTTMQSKSISVEGDKSSNFWGIGTYIYFAYPATYAALTSILDPNSFEVLPSFEYSASVPITSSGLTYNWSQLYKVYRLRLLASPQGLFQFFN